MRKTGSEYRQQVADFRARLDAFARGVVPKSERPTIDPSQRRTLDVPSRIDSERFAIYGRRRFTSVARVLALFEVLRDVEKLASRPSPVEVKATGAFWQAFRGTTSNPACHTCPALLLLDGNLPTLMTPRIGLRQYLIAEFADCMGMPALINKVDRAIDDQAGWTAFEDAASLVLNDATVSWRQGLERYTEGLRVLFPEMLAILHREFRFPDPETQQQLEAVEAFYEGLFLTPINTHEVEHLMSSARAALG